MTLAMLQSEDCGGFLSSLTMGMPLGPFGAATRETRVCHVLDECLALPVLRDLGLLEMCRKFLTFAKENCFQQVKPQHTYNPWGTVQARKREWAPYLAGYRGMVEVHSGGPLLEPQAEGLLPTVEGAAAMPTEPEAASPSADGAPSGGAASRSDEWNGRTVVYCLLVISLAHAFFDIRLSKEICSPKLFEKLELYALLACDGFGRMSQLYRAFGLGPSPEVTSLAIAPEVERQRPPMGAAFFDDEAIFFLGQEQDVPNCGAAAVGAIGASASSAVPGGGSEPSPEGRPSVHSLTSVLCWAAADRLQRIAAHWRCDQERAEFWRRRALEMHEEVCRHAWNPQRGAFTTYWGGSKVGPSLLRLAELGFISAEDGRFRGTLRAFEEDALSSSVCLGSQEGPPGTVDEAGILMAPSACFMTNTLLWYCEALRSTGAPAESRRVLEALLMCSKHHGFLSESVDLRTSELWGNAPSAAALLSLLRVAPRLSRSWREV
eukprot:CAMPEP_0180824594 /NCGR_PEP_ID=MMETSP1038_2-20121128/72519_1 /TAXON_ID=632150 /ORGANISM="Azadinium spinosum, Strain 3D9" /LENGTH=490 /DNA_ID=CAMNT_0022866997 /DNA_START=1 /DNA_END=1473 /DNA_ORIENTATION=+